MSGLESETAGDAFAANVRDSYGFVIGDHTVQINNYGTKTWSYAPAKEPLADGARVTGSPYRGLGVYEAGDEDLFFGREAAVAHVLDRMAGSAAGTSSGVLVVSGVSGAGKSSLLRAGILPQLQRQGLAGLPLAAAWPRLLFTPTGRPLDELAVRVAALARIDAAEVRRGLAADPEGFALTARQAADVQLEDTPGGRLVLVIDQFEQLFTQCSDETQQRAFVTALHAAASGPAPAALVVLGVRADFEAGCADYPELVRPVQDRYLLTAMTEPELRLTITEPARRAGARADDGLVDHLLDQVRGRHGSGGSAGAGVLPLLSHALDQTWRNHTGDTLTIADYRATGGIEAAVATSAQRAYESLPPAGRDTTRLVFLRLTATAADATDTATPASRAELEEGEDPVVLQAVLDAFVAERMLTVGAQMVELSHEVLLSAWPLLRDDWLAQTRADRLVRTRLRETAGEWAAHDRNPSYLYRGVLLASAQSLAANAREAPRRYPPLSPDETAFVRTSHSASRRRTRQLRGVAALLAALVLVLAGVSAAVIRADRETAGQRDFADAGELAAKSLNMGLIDPVEARLDAVAAWRIDPSLAAARYALQEAAMLPLRYSFDGVSTPALAFSPRGSTFALNSLAGVTVYSFASGLPVHFIAIPAGGDLGQASALAFSSDGKTLAIGTRSEGIYLEDTATWRETARLPDLGSVDSLAFAPDGRLAEGNLGAPNVHGLDLWTAVQPGSWHVASTNVRGEQVSSVAFSPDGRLLAAATGFGAVLIDERTFRPVGTVASGVTFAVAFSPASTDILATAGVGGAQLWNVVSQRLTRILEPGPKEPLLLQAVAFSPDGGTLAVGDGRAIQQWNVATGSQEGNPIVTGDGRGGANYAVFSPDGSTLATLSQTSVLLWYRSAVTGTPGESLPGTAVSSYVAFAPASVLAVGSLDGLRIWNAATGKPASPLQPQVGGRVSFSRDGTVFATTTALGRQVVLADTVTKATRALPAGASVESLAVSPNGKLLAYGSGASAVELWDIASPSPALLATLSVPAGAGSLAFSPDGTRLAAVVQGPSSSLYLWDVPSGHPDPVYSRDAASTVAWSPDGKLLALGDGGQAFQYELDSGLNEGLPLPTGRVKAAAWSPDGSVLAIGTAVGTELWNTVTGQQIGATLPDAAGVNSLAWSQDGTDLAVGAGGQVDADGGPTQVWNLSALAAASLPAAVCAQAGRGQTLSAFEWSQAAPGIPYVNVCP